MGGRENTDTASLGIESNAFPQGPSDSFILTCIDYGNGFDHSGLTVWERQLIEQAYKQGTIKLLTATSTLAVGVNLPARRVIFREPFIAREFFDVVRYKQMAGRAGRAA